MGSAQRACATRNRQNEAVLFGMSIAEPQPKPKRQYIKIGAHMMMTEYNIRVPRLHFDRISPRSRVPSDPFLNRSRKANGMLGSKKVLRTPRFRSSSSYKAFFGSTNRYLSPSQNSKCRTKSRPRSGVPIDTKTSRTPRSSRSVTSFDHCSACSWHRGHPSDLKNTTIDDLSVLSIKSSTIRTGRPFRTSYAKCFRRAA